MNLADTFRANHALAQAVRWQREKPASEGDSALVRVYDVLVGEFEKLDPEYQLAFA